MCNFFSVVQDVNNKIYYFDKEQRDIVFSGKRLKAPNWQRDIEGYEFSSLDSHSRICAFYQLNEDECNKWEWPLEAKKPILQMNNIKRLTTCKEIETINRFDLLPKKLINLFNARKLTKATMPRPIDRELIKRCVELRDIQKLKNYVPVRIKNSEANVYYKLLENYLMCNHAAIIAKYLVSKSKSKLTKLCLDVFLAGRTLHACGSYVELVEPSCCATILKAKLK